MEGCRMQDFKANISFSSNDNKDTNSEVNPELLPVLRRMSTLLRNTDFIFNIENMVDYRQNKCSETNSKMNSFVINRIQSEMWKQEKKVDNENKNSKMGDFIDNIFCEAPEKPKPSGIVNNNCGDITNFEDGCDSEESVMDYEHRCDSVGSVDCKRCWSNGGLNTQGTFVLIPSVDLQGSVPNSNSDNSTVVEAESNLHLSENRVRNRLFQLKTVNILLIVTLHI